MTTLYDCTSFGDGAPAEHDHVVIRAGLPSAPSSRGLYSLSRYRRWRVPVRFGTTTEYSRSGAGLCRLAAYEYTGMTLMAEKVLVELVDDLDGSPATQSVDFSLDGQRYTIDLNDVHAHQLRDVLTGYARFARRCTSSPAPTAQQQRRKNKEANDVLTQHIRTLAAANKQTPQEPQQQAATIALDTPPPMAPTPASPANGENAETTGGLFLAPPSDSKHSHTHRAGKPTSAPAPAVFNSAG